MADTFVIKIYSPAGLEREDETASVRLQAAEGEIGILPEHAGYIGQLGTGLLEYESAGTGQKKIAVRGIVNGGFCSFEANIFSVLADEYISLDKIDRSSYDKERDTLLQVLHLGALQDPEVQRAQREIAKIRCIDEVIAH